MLTLKIISPERIIFTGPVEVVTVPGTSGNFQILKDHAPIISSLESGVVEYKTKEARHSINIEGGFVEVKKNEISLCVEV